MSIAPPRPVRRRRRGRWYRLAAIGLVIAVVYVVARHPARMPELIAFGIGLGIAVVLSRYPVHVVTAIVSFLPLSVFVYSYAFKLGVPRQVVHQAQSWKELLIGTLLIAAVRSFRDRPRKLDRLDWAALAYIIFLLVYYLLPHLFAFGTTVLPHATRYAALRDDVEYVIAFFAARHAGIRRSDLRTIASGVLITGAIVACGGVYEHFRPHSWSHFVLSTVGVGAYRAAVQHKPLNPKEVLDYDAGHLRVGSFLLSPITLGPYLLVPLGLAVERLARRAVRSAANIALFVLIVLIGGAMLYTGTRSSVIGLVLVPLLALRPEHGRTSATRMRLAAALLVLVVIGIPALAHSTIITRTTRAIAGTDGSANAHVDQFHAGVHQIAVHPLGGGLGTVASIGQSLDPQHQVTAEDYYLQVGDEVGIHTMIAFMLLTIFTLLALYRSVSSAPDEEASGGAWLAGVALVVGAGMLHIWAGLVVSLVFWPLAGAVIGAADDTAARAGGASARR